MVSSSGWRMVDIEGEGGDALKVRRRKWASCVRMLSEPSREQQFDNSNPSSNKKYPLHNQWNTRYKSEKYLHHNQRNTQDSNDIWEIHLARSYSGCVRVLSEPGRDQQFDNSNPPLLPFHTGQFFSADICFHASSAYNVSAIGFIEEQQLFCLYLCSVCMIKGK